MNYANSQTVQSETEDIFELSIEELLQLEIIPTATLTRTTQRNQPAAITTITKDDIRTSNARSVDELLELYVPNFQEVHTIWETPNIGIRGTISDRDDKYLLLVNGKIMNERAHYGAMSERDLPMLQDINRIEVVRGPGSALYGPGALSMVINIITDTPHTFQGLEVTSRIGAIDEFYTWETKYGTKFKDDAGLLLYAGLAEQPGMSSKNAPFTPGISEPTPGYEYSGTEPLTYDYLPGQNHSFRDLTKIKLYSQYQKEDINLWARYTRGGNYYNPKAAYSNRQMQGQGYQQLTFFAGNKWRINEQFDIDYSISYDTFDYQRKFKSVIMSHRQDEYQGKVIANWRPNEKFALSFGGEYSHEKFGYKSPGWPTGEFDGPYSDAYGTSEKMPKWSTDTKSILAEMQWQFADKWTMFLGARMDWHTFTEEMFSPRLALVNCVNEKDTLKYIISKSVRASTAEDMKKNYDDTGEKSDFEQFDNYEVRWERQHNENLWFAISGFYNKRSVVAWVHSDAKVGYLGDMEIFGVELEAVYKKDKWKIVASHGYSQLINFKLKNDSIVTYLSSEPSGFGNDLSNWHDHITKISARYDVNEKLNINGSLVAYWGSPGRRDSIDYISQTNPDYLIAGFKDSAKASYFLNMGIGYDYSENLRINVNAHNILGWIDAKYNKVDNGGFSGYHGSSFFTMEPSFSVSVTYRF